MPADQRFLDQTLETLLSAPKNQVDLSELAEALITEFGGPRAFAKTVRQHFQDSAPGGMQRGQAMKMILGVVEKHASLTKADSRPEQSMSDEELRINLELLARDMQTPDASAASPPSEPPAELAPRVG